MAYKPAQWEAKFIELYKATGNITLSAHGAGTTRTTVWRRKQDQPEFVKLMRAAKTEAIERLEAEAWKRARESSDTLLIFLLKGLKPKMYRENIKLTIEGKVPLEIINQAILAAIEKGVDPVDMFNRIIQKAHADSG